MFNTLKEMQDTLPYDDLYKYASESLDKSPVEIKELLKSYNVEISDAAANECYEYIKSIDIVSEEELENVSGGTCYSSGITDPYNNIARKYVIVTAFNPCPFNGMTDWVASKTCNECGNSFTNGPTMYCNLRWKGHNTAKIEPNAFGPGHDALVFVDD